MRILNSDSRSRSAVGRIACDAGAASVRPRKRPPTTRISPASPLRRTRTRRAVGRDTAAAALFALHLSAAQLLRRCLNRLSLAMALDGDAAAFAIGYHVGAWRTGGSRMLRMLIAARAVKAATQRLLLFAVRRAPGMAHRLVRALIFALVFALVLPFVVAPRSRRGRKRHREIRAGLDDQARSELLAQGPRADLLDLALGQFAELERTERHADEPCHGQAERAQHVTHFAVLALADREGEPQVGALDAVERGLDRAVLHALDADAGAQAIELLLRHRAVGAHPIAAQPAGRRQFQDAGERAVVGQQQQALGIEIEPADADQPRQVLGQPRKDRRPAARVGMRGQEAARLVIKKQACALARRQRLAIDGDAVMDGDIAGRRADYLAIDGDAPGRDPRLGFAARGESGARDRPRDAFAVIMRPGVFVHNLLPIAERMEADHGIVHGHGA